MKKLKKKTTEKISKCEIEDMLQRTYLNFTPEDFVTVEEKDTQESESERK